MTPIWPTYSLQQPSQGGEALGAGSVRATGGRRYQLKGLASMSSAPEVAGL